MSSYTSSIVAARFAACGVEFVHDSQKRSSKALDEAFRAAFLLTGSTGAAENAVLDGIAALEFGYRVAS